LTTINLQSSLTTVAALGWESKLAIVFSLV